jgi:hypothetical protein
MFWRKKQSDKAKVEQSRRPPVEELDAFVEWLLRFGADFEEYRQVLRGTMNGFVANYTPLIATEVSGCTDEAGLTRHLQAECVEYADNFKHLTDTAGGLKNLPSHLFDKVFPRLVKLRLLMYVRQQKYEVPPTAEMLAVIGPLNEI